MCLNNILIIDKKEICEFSGKQKNNGEKIGDKASRRDGYRSD